MKQFDCKTISYRISKMLFSPLKPAACTLLLLCALAFRLHAQSTLTATASFGSAYPVISAAGFGNENPDCIHTSFGDTGRLFSIN